MYILHLALIKYSTDLFREEAGVDVAVEVGRNITLPESTSTFLGLQATAYHLIDVEVLPADCRTLGGRHDVATLFRFHPQRVHVL